MSTNMLLTGYYLREEGYVFICVCRSVSLSVCPSVSVCLSVCLSFNRIIKKLLTKSSRHFIE